MQPHNIIAFFMTVPMAAYYSYFTFVTPDNGIRTVSDTRYSSPSCNCTKPLVFRDAGIEIMSKLTEIDIPKESRMEIMNMLDKLNWVDIQSCGSKLNLEHFFNNKNELFGLLLLNSISFVIMHVLTQLTQDTCIGSPFKAAYGQISSWFERILNSATWLQLVDQFHLYLNDKEKETTAATTAKDERSFEKCSSTVLPGKEEIIPNEEDFVENLNFEPIEENKPDRAIKPDETCYFDTLPTDNEIDATEKVEEFLRKSHEHVEELTDDNSLLNIDDDTFKAELDRIRETHDLM